MSTLDPYDINAVPVTVGFRGARQVRGGARVAPGTRVVTARWICPAYGMYPGQDPNFDAFVRPMPLGSPDVGHGWAH